jgi:5-methyltetrahydrofolate corrinoid/iron sulfur protein methyltransferase
MIVVAENVNVMSKSIGPAMKNKDPDPILKMAEKCVKNGSDYLDINLGPARKGGPERMAWLVELLQSNFNKPCYLDTSNAEAIEAGLQVHKSDWGRPVINSISADPGRMELLFPLCKKYDAEAVALLYGPDGIPRDENERGELAATLQATAAEREIPESDLWYDPIVVPVSSQQQQVISCTTFMSMVPAIAPEAKSTCGLSNVSNGSPEKLRPILNQTYLCMLRHHGLYSAILDGLDSEILNIAKDGFPELDELCGKVADGEEIPNDAVSEKMLPYLKTAKLLMGKSLYSDSWLDL